MKKGSIVYALGLTLVTFIGTFSQAEASRPMTLQRGAVYVMTNQIANAVMAFRRHPQTGALALVDTEPTQGAGNPTPIPPDPPIDPLGSQGAIIRDEDNRFIYAVNAGSHEISVLAIESNGLTFVQKVPSLGTRPISLTIWNNWLYVLNEGGTPNITGFLVAANGTLTPIPGSTRPLIGGAGADPAQVGFNNDGTLLVVSEKAGNRLDTYAVNAMGVAGPPNANPSAGMTPFGFAFGRSDFLFVSEAGGGMPMMSSVSSYEAGGTMLDVISAAVPNNQTAACWLVVTRNGRFIFVSNTASDTISSYRLASGEDDDDDDIGKLASGEEGCGDDVGDDGCSGQIELLAAVAANTGPMSAPIDLATSNNSRFLYVLENGSHVVSGWRIGNNGSLTLIGEFGVIPAGAQGIAAR